MNQRIRHSVAIIIVIVLLAACRRPAPTATPAATSTLTPTRRATASPTPAPTATLTPTLLPTSTAQPSPIQTPAPSATSTLGPGGGQLSPTATQPQDEPIPTLTPSPVRFVTSTPPPSLAYEAAYSSVSPDRRWVAQGVALPPSAEMTYRTQLTVWRTDGSVEWAVVDQVSNWGLGWTAPRPFHWSHDGRFLYFTDYGVPDGCPGFGNGWGLRKVDLADGRVSEVIPDLGNWMALSPQEERLAYVPRSTHGVVIRDLTTGQESTFALNTGRDDSMASIGHILWSPDGSALLLTVALDRCQSFDKLRHTVVRLDLATGEETVLVDLGEPWLVTQSWLNPDETILLDGQERHWRMDANSGELSPAADLDLALPDACRADVPGTSLYTNPADGYCLRYPDFFHVGDVYQRIANLYGPPLDQSIEPLMAGVGILVEGPVGKRTLPEAVDEWFIGRNLPPPEMRYFSALGDELAEVVVYRGERTQGRALFALHENMLYVLSFYPDDERFAQAMPDMEAAWEQVTASFTFLSPKLEEAYAALCPANDPDSSPYYDLDDGYCLLYPTHFGVGDIHPGMAHFYGPPLDQSVEPVQAILTIALEGPAGGRSLDDIVDKEANPYPGLPITRTAALLGGEPAVVVDGLPGRTMLRQAFAIHNGLVYRAVIQSVGNAFPQAAPDVEAAWQALLDSFTFLPDYRAARVQPAARWPGDLVCLRMVSIRAQEGCPVPAEWIAYENTSLGLRFRHPADWVIEIADRSYPNDLHANPPSSSIQEAVNISFLLPNRTPVMALTIHGNKWASFDDFLDAMFAEYDDPTQVRFPRARVLARQIVAGRWATFWMWDNIVTGELYSAAVPGNRWFYLFHTWALQGQQDTLSSPGLSSQVSLTEMVLSTLELLPTAD